MKKMVEGDENQAFKLALLLEGPSFKKIREGSFFLHTSQVLTIVLKMQIKRDILCVSANPDHLFVLLCRPLCELMLTTSANSNTLDVC